MRVRKPIAILAVIRLGVVVLGLAAVNVAAAQTAAGEPWQSCVSSIAYDQPAGAADSLRVTDRFGRDISNAGIPLMDWEGFVENPQFRFNLNLPDSAVYPVRVRVTATDAPRLYVFQRQQGADPYDIRDWLSVHNETGPLWGVILKTASDGRWVNGGVPHDMPDQALADIGLVREERFFGPEQFPLELHLGVHPDREAGDEDYTLQIEVTDAAAAVFQRSLPVHVCDQDRPERPVAFQFLIDYSYDFDGYLEDTPDGQVVKAAHERTLHDLAYFFTDMQFDEVPAGACEVTVNFTIETRPATGVNGQSYDRGHYVFITSHSGGGGLNGPVMHKRNGIDTDFAACSFWGANPRNQLSSNVSNRLYVPEDDWWRVVSWNYGQNGECLGDALGDPGSGCIQCPNDEPWCAYQRGDLYWPNLHELNHGLTMATGWPRWHRWFFSDDLCIDDPDLMRYSGTCLPMYRTDHVVLFGETFESNKQADWGRTLFRKYDFLLMKAVGWELRDTTMLVNLTVATASLSPGQLGQTYNEAIEVYGGVPSYRFVLQSGELPAGLKLNSFTGRLSGTPSAPGTYRFTLRIEDSDEYNVLRKGGEERTYEVTING